MVEEEVEWVPRQSKRGQWWQLHLTRVEPGNRQSLGNRLDLRDTDFSFVYPHITSPLPWFARFAAALAPITVVCHAPSVMCLPLKACIVILSRMLVPQALLIFEVCEALLPSHWNILLILRGTVPIHTAFRVSLNPHTVGALPPGCLRQVEVSRLCCKTSHNRTVLHFFFLFIFPSSNMIFRAYLRDSEATRIKRFAKPLLWPSYCFFSKPLPALPEIVQAFFIFLFICTPRGRAWLKSALHHWKAFNDYSETSSMD